MSVVCRWNGIEIVFYTDDHAPPHFHALYGSCRAKVDITTGSIRGHLPPAQARAVKDLVRQRRWDLLKAWWRVRVVEKPRQIRPPS